MSEILLGLPTYDPNALLDALIERMSVKNDSGLALALGIGKPAVSKMRHKQLAVTANILIRMNETSGISIRELRQLMGDNRERFGAIWDFGIRKVIKEPRCILSAY